MAKKLKYTRCLTFNLKEINLSDIEPIIENTIEQYYSESFFYKYEINNINQSQSDDKLIIVFVYGCKTKWLNIILLFFLISIIFYLLFLFLM